MLGFRYIKASPNTHLIAYRNGRIVREGAGRASIYFAPSTSVVGIPLASQDAPFVFRETTADFQEVTVQGQATYRVTDPAVLASRMDFTLKADGSHASEDPSRLAARVVNAIHVQVRAQVEREPMEALLTHTGALEQAVKDALRGSDVMAAFGLELVELSLLAIRPNPDTARALEAEVREQVLKRADDATYARRNSAVEQERAIRENELDTEIAVEEKRREIRDAQLEAERAELGKRLAIDEEAMAGRIANEDRRRELVALHSANSRVEADDKAYAARVLMDTLRDMDPRALQALVAGQADPGALIALAFQGLAENATKIGQLNVSPELLESLVRRER